jgi:hypothetical protein
MIEDPENPQNWSSRKNYKLLLKFRKKEAAAAALIFELISPSLYTCTVYVVASIYTPAVRVESI